MGGGWGAGPEDRRDRQVWKGPRGPAGHPHGLGGVRFASEGEQGCWCWRDGWVGAGGEQGRKEGLQDMAGQGSLI